MPKMEAQKLRGSLVVLLSATLLKSGDGFTYVGSTNKGDSDNSEHHQNLALITSLCSLNNGELLLSWHFRPRAVCLFEALNTVHRH
jgi:hypothetical protein